MTDRFNPFRILATSTLLSVLLFLTACGSNPKQVQLTYRLPVDAIYRQKTVSVQTVKQTFQGEQQVVTNTIVTVMSYRVKEVTAETTTMQVSYDTLDLDIRLPNRAMQFTSKGGFYQQNDLFSQLMHAMSGKHFTVKLNNKTGAVVSISGIEQLFERVLSQFSEANGEQLASIMEMLNKSYGENALRGSFEAMNGYFTDQQLKKDSEWEKTVHLSNIKSDLINNWKLTEIGRTEAVIESTGAIDTPDQPKEVSVEGVVTSMQMSGTQNATLTIDHTTGWPVSGSIKQHFTGTMHLQNAATMETAQLPIEMINTITYSTIE